VRLPATLAGILSEMLTDHAGDGGLVLLAAAAKRYAWRDPWVLKDLDLTVAPGRLVEVRGANGSGKSTLLRMLAGATLPTRGRRVAAAGLAVGYGPERLIPAPPFAAGTYLAHHARLRRLPEAVGSAHAAALAERLGVASLLGEPLRTLSKGSLQKVVIIQALLGEPALVILDEPFAGLDAEASVALCDVVSEVTAAGSTVLFSDHRERDVRPRADLVWRVSDGGVHEEPVRSVAVVARLSGVISTREQDGRVELIVAARASDAVLSSLIGSGWHVTGVAADGTPGRMRIDAVARVGAS
jgi:ABC-2 type transport system ATP-binding protein